MRIIIAGAGAMGCFFGGLLKSKGHDVVLIDISQIQIDSINSKGLLIETDTGKQSVNIPAHYAHEVTDKAELIIVFTKTYHTKKALESIKHLIDKDTYILTLQNGLGNVEKISEYADLSKIIVGMTNHPCELIGPGHVRSLGKGYSKIMSADGCHNPMLVAVNDMFNEAGLECEITEDVFCAIWEKVAFNTALNAIGAITHLTNGSIGMVPEGVSLAKSAAKEVIDVANKKGIQADVERVIKAIDSALTSHPNHVSSMLQDILAKRPTEIESLNGAVVREAQKLGVNVPITDTLYKIVRIKEQTYENMIINKI